MGFFDFWKRKGQDEQRALEYVAPTSAALLFGDVYGNNNAMNLSAVYRATEIISDAMATLPLIIKDANGKVNNHPVLRALDGNILTRYEFIKLLCQSVILKGNGFALVERDAQGNVTALRYVEAGDVSIKYSKTHPDTLYYNVTGLPKRIEACNMVHLVKNSYDGVNGISVLSYAARTLNIAQATENSSKNFFDKGMNLSGVLNVNTANLSKEQREQIFASWNSAYSNGGNGLVVLKGDWKYTPIQINAKDAQLLDSRHYNVSDIARFFGISPVLLGDLSNSSYNTIEAVQQDFLLHTLAPYVAMFQDEFNRKLLKPSERAAGLVIDFDETAILKGDKTAEAGYYTTLLNCGVLSINEVREKIGYAAIEGGDRHIIPFSNIDKNTVSDTTPTE